jgi:dephospho-CoA kinase
MAAQAEEEKLVRSADMVVRNHGDLDQLAAEADRVWERLTTVRDGQ